MLSVTRRAARQGTQYVNSSLPKRLFSSQFPFFKVAEEVREALQSGKPVVALESTIYTHGFPYPDNIALSSLLESVVRKYGAVPATIGVLNGIATVGMQPEEIIQLLETSGSPDTVKVSRRDLAYLCGSGIRGKKYNGGTTIAGTMVLAHLAGIKVFATGGLGGVHKGGENSMDVSADLTELGRTPIALISSGCKSFLDIPRTLEYLETQGVGVSTFADSREGPVEFPAFWTRESGTPSPEVVQDEKDAAAIIYAQRHFPLSSGLLFANPIPADHSLSKTLMDEAMAQAVQDASEEGISGSANTPFVLSRIREITQGSTVAANRVLIEANVERGAKVAVELAKLEINDGTGLSQRSQQPNLQNQEAELPHNIDVLVAGSIALDLSCDYAPSVDAPVSNAPVLQTSNPAENSHSLGGVGQNVATACHYSGVRTQLCSLIGDDPPGNAILLELQARGIDNSTIYTSKNGTPTAQYVAVNDTKKDLVLAMADMRIFEKNNVPFETLWKPVLDKARPKWVVVDGNWDAGTLKQWIEAAKSVGARIAFEPVSVEKSVRLLHEDWKNHLDNLLKTRTLTSGERLASHGNQLVDLASPNEMEVIAMAGAIRGLDAWTSYISGFPDGALREHIKVHLRSPTPDVNLEAAVASLKLLSRIPCVITKLGSSGVLLSEFLPIDDPRLSDPAEAKHIISRRAFSSTKANTPLIIPENEEGGSLDRIAGVYMRLFMVPEQVEPQDVVSVNGVGDTFLGVLVSGLTKGQPVVTNSLIKLAQRGAALTLRSKHSVSPDLKQLRL